MLFDFDHNIFSSFLKTVFICKDFESTFESIALKSDSQQWKISLEWTQLKDNFQFYIKEKKGSMHIHKNFE